MPFGKPAGIPCVHLLDDARQPWRCELFGLPSRPAVCVSLRPQADMCGTNREHALALLHAMELGTRPRQGEPNPSERM